MRLAEYLKEFQHPDGSRGLSARRFALRIGLPVATVADVVNGRTIPRADTAQRIIEGSDFRVSLSDLATAPDDGAADA